MNSRRVVITGMGSITPIGNCVSSYWDALLQGKNGANEITLFDASRFKTRFACEVKDFHAEEYISRRDLRRMDRFSQFALIASKEALESAFDSYKDVDKNEIGVVWGSGVGGIHSLEKGISDHARGDGTPHFSPFFIPKMIIDISAGWISMVHGLRGPNFGIVSACASASHAIILAMLFIRSGQARVVLTGGSDACITMTGVGSFNALKALSERNEDYESACRPFDKDRDGFVLGEGAGCIILEEYEHAKARGAKIYAEVVGGGMSADAYHLTAPHAEGEGIYLSMQRAIKDAKISAEDIGYVNAHATSTLLGDAVEVQTIQKVFGDHAKKLYIGATKSMTGHLLGASGAVEAIAAVKSLESGRIPPTINHFELSPELDESLNYCFSPPDHVDLKAVMSNSFGFGGHNATLIFCRCED